MLRDYPINLTDGTYGTMLLIINDKRKPQHWLKDVIYAIFYLLKTGCQLCILPNNFPKLERVYRCDYHESEKYPQWYEAFVDANRTEIS